MTEIDFKVGKNAEVLQQYLLQKTAIMEKLKGTYLLPYLLTMQYLVGKLNDVTITDDPIEEIGPYLNIQDGINQKLNVKFTREELQDWEIFRYFIRIPRKDTELIDELKIFILVKINGNSIDLLTFGIFDFRILDGKTSMALLDSDVKVIETKKALWYVYSRKAYDKFDISIISWGIKWILVIVFEELMLMAWRI